MAAPIPKKIGKYDVIDVVGRGGMGVVYRAKDPFLDRMVAIKTSSAKFSERFEREARAVAALNHPYICQLYDVGPNYLVMELLEGETLAARLKRGKLSIDDSIKYGAQIADALDAAHSKGIIHRDLKPDNLFLCQTSDGDITKVLDFGSAKDKGESAKKLAADGRVVFGETEVALDQWDSILEVSVIL